MYMLWVIAVFSALAGAYALFDSESIAAMPSATGRIMAASMSAYRHAVVEYALANPTFTGEVPESALVGNALLTTDASDALWRNYVIPNTDAAGSLVVIYSTQTSAENEIVDMQQLAQGSALAGVASAGNVVSPGNPHVPLPSALSSVIPDGEPVWMAQAYD